MTSVRHLTFMFTDIVGSTALFTSVSPREGNRIRSLHFQILENALAATDGTLVTNLGDGAMAVFDSASQAVACAVLLQQSSLSDRHPAGGPIQIRIGLSTGDATRDGDDYFGDPIVEAARLCALAEPGQILAAERVRMVAGRHATQRTETLGPRQLKGLPDPVGVEVLQWDPAPVIDYPMPTRLRRPPEFFGRASELEVLDEALAAAAAGGAHLAVVSGDAGIGKTALAAEFAARAHDRDAVVLLGRCDEHARSPFHPFEEALAHYVMHAPEGALAAYVRDYGPDLVRIVPELARRLPGLAAPLVSDPDAERHVLFRAVAGLLASASVLRPVVLVLDDLHRADDDSMSLLRHVALSADTHRALVLATYRTGEAPGAAAMSGAVASLAREVDATRISLEGWREPDLAEILGSGEDAEAERRRRALARLLAEETGGNPFFVTEMLHHLSETGAVVRRPDGGWTVVSDLVAKSLPSNVRDVLAERLEPLGADCLEVLNTAAVIGHDFDLELCRRVVGRGPEEVLDLLELAQGASLVRETTDVLTSSREGRFGASFSFNQAIIRRALLDTLPPSRQMLLHLRVAKALEEIGSTGRAVAPSDLAFHFASAGPEYAAEALDYSVAAGEVAMRQLAFGEAFRHFERALSLNDQAARPDGELGIDLRIALGTAERQAGMGDYRGTLADAARLAIARNDGERLVAAALADSRGFTSLTGAVDAELVEILEAALAACPPGAPERALLLASLCSELQYGSDFEHRRRLAREAEELCAALGDPALAVTVANRVFTSVQTSYSLVELLRKTEATLRAAEGVGDPVQQFWAQLWRGYALRSAGSERQALAHIDEAARTAGAVGQPLLTWWVTNVVAVGALVAGDPREVDRLAAAARELGTTAGQPDAAALAEALQAGAAWQRGLLPEIGPLVDAALAERPGEHGLLMIRLLTYAEADDVAACRAVLADLDAVLAALPLASTYPFALTIHAEAAIRAGDERAAAVLIDRLQPWADQVAHTGATVAGPVSHYLAGLCALVGRDDEADEWYEWATVIADGMSAAFFGARTALDRGAVLAARRDLREQDRARALLGEAHAAAEANGYAVIERRAAAALAMLA